MRSADAEHANIKSAPYMKSTSWMVTTGSTADLPELQLCLVTALQK